MALTLSPEDLEAIADAVWDETLTGATHNVPTSAGRRLRQLAGNIVIDGIALGAGANGNQIILGANASDIDGAYDPAVISIVDGTGAGQSRLILAYDGTTHTATVDRDWKVNPDETSEYIIFADPGREHVNEGLAQGGGASTITLNALASSVDDAYVGQVIFIRSGLGADQACRITDYDGTTKVATVAKAWHTAPDATSAYVMLPTSILDLALFIQTLWGYESRTLTQSAAGVLAAVDGDEIVILRGDTVTVSLSNLGDISTRTALYFTMKGNPERADADALVQVTEAGGLVVLNGSSIVIPLNGELTVTDENAGDVTITLKAAATYALPLVSGVYDVQMISAAGVFTKTQGEFRIVPDVTHAIS